jgi:hypothetical protein
MTTIVLVNTEKHGTGTNLLVHIPRRGFMHQSLNERQLENSPERYPP